MTMLLFHTQSTVRRNIIGSLLKTTIKITLGTTASTSLIATLSHSVTVASYLRRNISSTVTYLLTVTLSNSSSVANLFRQIIIVLLLVINLNLMSLIV